MKKVTFTSILSAVLVNLLYANPSSAISPQSAYQCFLNGGESPWYYVTWYDDWNYFNLGTSQGRNGLYLKKQGDMWKEKRGKTYTLSVYNDYDEFVLQATDQSERYECSF